LKKGELDPLINVEKETKVHNPISISPKEERSLNEVEGVLSIAKRPS
jgi:hypothetical protein